MNTDNLVFRTVFVDRDVDAEVLARAKRLQMKPESIYRLFLEVGLKQASLCAVLPEPSTDSTVVRTVHVSVASDDKLTGLECRLGFHKFELTRRVTRLGMLTVQARGEV